MKTVLLPFYSFFKKSAVLSLFLTLTTTAFAQENMLANNVDSSTAPVADGTKVIDRDGFGTAIEDEDGKIISYETNGMTVKVGDKIKFKSGKSLNGSYEYAKRLELGLKVMDGSNLDGGYAGRTFTIKEIKYSWGNYRVYIKLPGLISAKGEIEITPAITNGEVEIIAKK